MKALLASLALLLVSPALADPEAIENYFRALDLNGDGFVSIAEAAGDEVIVSRFDKADRNRDGKLSSKEFANLRKVKVRVAKGKDKDRSAAVGGTSTRAERKRARAEKGEGGG